jgi:hypothetical protein
MCDDPPPEIRKLDFSQFHPLDHSVFRCRDYPGGRRRHLAYRWEFQWREHLGGWFLCPFGRHHWGKWWTRGPDAASGMHCTRCFADKP